MEVTRYITVPAGRPTICDIVTGKPKPVQDITYLMLLRVLTLDAEMAKTIDALDRMEIRLACEEVTGEGGGVIVLKEDQHKHIVDAIRRKPICIGDENAFSPNVHKFLMHIVKAPAEAPPAPIAEG